MLRLPADADHQLWMLKHICTRLPALVGQDAPCLSCRERRMLFPPPFGGGSHGTAQTDALWSRNDVTVCTAALSATGL